MNFRRSLLSDSRGLAAALNRTGFVAHAQLGSAEQNLAFAQIPPLLRLLLVTDGTVTKSLEAYFAEPVVVQLQTQALQPPRHWPLHAAHSDSVALDQSLQPLLSRQVKLCGEQSGLCYAQADSWIAIDLLPKHLAEGLLAGQLGIGELVRSQGLDTYRALQDLGVLQQDGQTWVWRDYAICTHQRELMRIREHFPLALYAAA
jgi:chorismate-pyruvate lyase